jgi:predicted DNA binding CopG/RHH family protein
MITFVLSLPEKQINMNASNTRSIDMREQYDFSNSVPNPYVKKLKKQITIRLDQDVIEYFKQLSEQNGVPYQNLINLYLKDCAQSHKELKLDWQ